MTSTHHSRTDTRSKSKETLTCIRVESANASEALLRDMWQLRRAYLSLNISEQEDFAKFKDYCTRPNTYLFTFRDAKQALQAFYTFSFHPSISQGHKVLLMHSKYYYVNTLARGNPKIPASALPLLPEIIWKFGFRRIYVIAFSFPTSYVSLTRTFGTSYTLQGKGLHDWEKTMLEGFVVDLNGDDWDRELKIVRNQNVPLGEAKAATKGVTALRQNYIDMNPEWEQGTSLPTMMKMNFKTIKDLLMTNVRRAKR